ncbi:MAG: hypothetical protein KH359_13090 [Clostridiales bacterium]|nr:hypothetical protein [Clostridiales bacterium]
MKHKIQKVELFVGVIVLLGGLLTYGLGVHQLLPVPRPDLVVYGTTLIGIILILMGVLFALIFMGYMSKVVFFSIVGVIAIGQITWVITARYLDKKM